MAHGSFMDEEWFYAIQTKTNQKVVASEGVLLSDFDAQHKSHIGKEMYVVMTGYCLNNENDITKGWQAFPISLVRVGRMVKATKDSYKRVYIDNGTYHYPKIAANKLWTKGVEYFQAVGITGSKEGTDKDPKLSLINVHRHTIIPDMEMLERKLSENDTKNVIFVRQEYGADPHTDKIYIQFMASEFERRD